MSHTGNLAYKKATKFLPRAHASFPPSLPPSLSLLSLSTCLVWLLISRIHTQGTKACWVGLMTMTTAAARRVAGPNALFSELCAKLRACPGLQACADRDRGIPALCG